jgi:hypothetical protein
MAGLAAALNAPASIDAIAWALGARGSEGAVCRLTGPGGTCLDLGIRAAMPTITRVVAAGDDVAEDQIDEQPLIAALVVDGIASVTALDLAYAERGPAGLVDGGDQPYAVVVADAERGELVLARNGTGPTLYYARHDDGWLVASEPGALVHAGTVPEPDVGVIRRFIQSGTCDEADRTFFARIRRLLPGEAVVLSTAVSGPVRHPIRLRPPAAVEMVDAIWAASAGARVALLTAPGVAGAAVLGGALHHPERTAPLSAFSVALGGLDGRSGGVPAVLANLPPNSVRHTELVASLDLSTVDRFLADMGEPVPDLGIYLLWTVARELAGGIQTLIDAMGGSNGAAERVADRMLAHYGVVVRAPLRGRTPDEAVLTSVVRRTLPPQVVQQALADPARPVSSAQVVLALRDEVAAALVPPRPWSDAAATVTALRRLQSGEQVEADALLRAFLVERWLAGLGPHATVPAAAVIIPTSELPVVPLREPDEVLVGGDLWCRTPVRTAQIAPGDQLLANTAFYVANALTARGEAPSGPWFAVLSGKVVAVSQKRVAPVVAVKPGRLARVLAWLARRRWPHLSQPWAMQVAIDHSGLSTMIGAVLFGGVLPAEAAVYPPRVGALSPGDTAVVRPPQRPDDVAESVVAALRLALSREAGRTLAGVAVVSADDRSCRLLGFAPGPAVDAAPRPRALLSLVLADNPAGQGEQRTPIVIVTHQTTAAAERTRRTVDLAVRAR